MIWESTPKCVSFSLQLLNDIVLYNFIFILTNILTLFLYYCEICMLDVRYLYFLQFIFLFLNKYTLGKSERDIMRWDGMGESSLMHHISLHIHPHDNQH